MTSLVRNKELSLMRAVLSYASFTLDIVIVVVVIISVVTVVSILVIVLIVIVIVAVFIIVVVVVIPVSITLADLIGVAQLHQRQESRGRVRTCGFVACCSFGLTDCA